MRTLAVILLTVTLLVAALLCGGRLLDSRFTLGKYSYVVGSEPINEATIAKGLHAALADRGIDPNAWVPIAGWPIATQAQKPFGAHITLSNHLKETYYLYVKISQTSNASPLQYDIHRSK